MAFSAKRKLHRNSALVRKGSDSDELAAAMQELDIAAEYELISKLGSGRFGSAHLANHKRSGTTIALKIFPKRIVKQTDFLREYNYSYFLSPHQSIIDTYEGTYICADSHFFVQEYAERGSLRTLIEANTGSLAETVVKQMIVQVFAALEYMHSEKLVHRNVSAENVLLFGSGYDRVKLAGFSLTRKVESLVKHTDMVNSYHAPELCETLQKEAYIVEKCVDTWAVGILTYYALRGRFPWKKASIMCKPYWEWEQWLKRKNPQLPKAMTRFTEKALKLFKKSLNPKSKERSSVKDLKKYLKEKWLKEMKVSMLASY